ncbi:MAG: hypothetical protein JWQ44_824 [Chthoniobacter sp.]|jgi:hypothetical protein|nr:hypothetical protein [Chthoniobacter sp.]
MILDRFQELMKLTNEERAQLSHELSRTVNTDEPITDPEIIGAMERNMEAYRQDPSLGREWSEVRTELRAQYIDGPRG